MLLNCMISMVSCEGYTAMDSRFEVEFLDSIVKRPLIFRRFVGEEPDIL